MHKQTHLYPNWRDKTVYIIGGGPSLINFNWSELRHKNVIAVNRAFQMVPWAQIMYWMDKNFYKWYKNDIRNFNGLKITSIAPDEPDDDIIILNGVQRQGIDLRPDYIARSRNSGAGAINLALKTGVSRIFLLGIDLQDMDDKSHWHSGYSEFGVTTTPTAYTIMQYDFWEIKKWLDDSLPHVKVFNASPDSKLEAFPKCSIDEAVNEQL